MFLAAILSGIVLSIFVAPAGLTMLTLARIDYEGVERWFPDVKNAEAELQRYIYELELSKETHRYALELLEQLRNKDLLVGREVEEIVAGIIYVSAREQGEPRTLDEIEDLSDAGKRDIGQAYRSIGRDTDVSIRPPDPEDFMTRFGEKLGLSDEAIAEAREIVQRAKERDLTSGKSPTSIASSAIYIAAYMNDEDRTMNDISDMLDVTTITIRNRSRELVSELGLEKYPQNLNRGPEN